jgi:hypothetical protein
MLFCIEKSMKEIGREREREKKKKEKRKERARK